MTEPTDAVLTSGVLARLVDLAAASRNPGAAPLEDELQRFARLMRDSRAIAWVMPFDAVASLLEALADEYGTERFVARPTVFLDRLARAAGDEHADAFLRTLAALLRAPWFGDCPGYDELPLSQWEALARFDVVNEFASQLPTGEYGSDPEAEARDLVATDHPDCHGRIRSRGTAPTSPLHVPLVRRARRGLRARHAVGDDRATAAAARRRPCPLCRTALIRKPPSPSIRTQGRSGVPGAARHSKSQIRGRFRVI